MIGQLHNTGTERPTAPAQRAPYGPARLIAVVLVVVAAIPPLVAAANVGDRWVPSGDEAVELFQVDRVGGLDTSLVGAYSTHSWAHPGPVLYYLLAVPYRLLGSDPTDLFVGAALLVALATPLIGWLAWRRRGLLGVAAALGMFVTMEVGLGPSRLVGIWNPFTASVPYFAFLLAAWGVAEDDDVMLPIAVALGSIVVQTHVGYTPLVVVGAASVAALRWIRRRDGDPAARPLSRSLRWTALVATILWLPPLVDLVLGSHNLAYVGGYFLTGRGGAQVGLADGVGILGSYVRPGGLWTGGPTQWSGGSLRPEVPWVLPLLIGALVLVLVAGRRRASAWPAAPLLALGQLAAGILAASRVERPVVP